VDGRESYQGVKDTNPVKATLEDLQLIDVLAYIVFYDCKLSRLHTLDGHSDVNDDGHETNAKGK